MTKSESKLKKNENENEQIYILWNQIYSHVFDLITHQRLVGPILFFIKPENM